MLSRLGYLFSIAALPLLAAEAPPPAPSPPAAGATATVTSTDQKKRLPDQYCLRETGTRIKRGHTCLPGEVITRDELDRAGGMTLSEKLPRLSTAIQRSGH